MQSGAASGALRRLIILIGLLPSSALGWELSGSVALVDGVDDVPQGAALAQGTVVYFEPTRPVESSRPAVLELAMQRKEFVPRVLAAPLGSTLRFPNRDPILHNVFSVSAGNEFDLGLYRAGEGKEVEVDRPGMVRIFCNVHHSMVAYALVLETPFFGRPAADGTFSLAGLPAGGGRLTVWNERAEPWSRELEEGASPVEVELRVDRERVPRHVNKFGKPYTRGRRRAY